MNTNKIAVVGLDIGHADKYAGMLREHDFQIAWVWDRDIEKARGFADKYECEVMSDLSGIDWSAICGGLIMTTTRLHKEVAVPFLQKGIPLYIDKQLATTWEDAVAMHRAARGSGTAFLSGSIRRYAPAYRSIRHKVQSQEYGRVLTAYIYEPHGVSPAGWQDRIEESGGFIVNFGVHCVDPLVSMLGADWVELNCQAGRLTHKTSCSEDTCLLTLTYRDGTMVTIEVIGSQYPIQATQPMLRVHLQQTTLEAWLDEGLARNYRGQPVYDPDCYSWLSGAQHAVLDMVKLFKTGVGSVSMDEQLEILRILLLARRSYEQGRRVRSDEFV